MHYLVTRSLLRVCGGHTNGPFGMTDQTHTNASTEGQDAGGDLFNTAAGWALGAGIVALGLWILSGSYFHATDPIAPVKPGYAIVVADTASDKPAEISFAEALTLVTAEQGEKIFNKCSSCHTIAAGGANGIGPNLHNIMGAPIGKHAGFSYSGGMASKGGNWGWEEMNQWLKKPSRYVEGTKMSFAERICSKIKLNRKERNY